MRLKTRMAFKVTGSVFLSNDEELVLPVHKISAHHAYDRDRPSTARVAFDLQQLSHPQAEYDLDN